MKRLFCLSAFIDDVDVVVGDLDTGGDERLPDADVDVVDHEDRGRFYVLIYFSTIPLLIPQSFDNCLTNTPCSCSFLIKGRGGSRLSQCLNLNR